MQVQSIQANQTTNNCRKPCFKAYFVHDANGNFNKLWETATFDKALEQRIYRLASNHENHALEIIGARNNAFGIFYKILNHYNGKISEYFTGADEGNRLYTILEAIVTDQNIFKNDSTSKAYRLLTGK